MKLPKQVIEQLVVRPGTPADLVRRSTSATGEDWFKPVGQATPKEVAEHDLEAFKEELAVAQELLYASDTWALLLVFQALDAAGKDGTVKHLMSGINPQGCEVFAFQQPSAEELRHDFLWRCVKALPERGRIGIFNRSYFEEVLVVRVHPELLARQHLPSGAASGSTLWRERYDDINAFERHLTRNGTCIIKFFLHVSEEEQRRRLLARLDDPAKQWKFSPQDLAERSHFGDYMKAYEEAITATTTSWAPWYVVPADHKYALRALVGGIVVHHIDQLDLRLPVLDASERQAVAAAREALRGEGSDKR